jgi:hypothetical protein
MELDAEIERNGLNHRVHGFIHKRSVNERSRHLSLDVQLSAARPASLTPCRSSFAAWLWLQ